MINVTAERERIAEAPSSVDRPSIDVSLSSIDGLLSSIDVSLSSIDDPLSSTDVASVEDESDDW